MVKVTDQMLHKFATNYIGGEMPYNIENFRPALQAVFNMFENQCFCKSTIPADENQGWRKWGDGETSIGPIEIKLQDGSIHTVKYDENYENDTFYKLRNRIIEITHYRPLDISSKNSIPCPEKETFYEFVCEKPIRFEDLDPIAIVRLMSEYLEKYK